MFHFYSRKCCWTFHWIIRPQLWLWILCPPFSNEMFNMYRQGDFGQRGDFGQIFNISLYYLCTKNFQIKCFLLWSLVVPIFVTRFPHWEIICTETVQRCWKVVQGRPGWWYGNSDEFFLTFPATMWYKWVATVIPGLLKNCEFWQRHYRKHNIVYYCM